MVLLEAMLDNGQHFPVGLVMLSLLLVSASTL